MPDGLRVIHLPVSSPVIYCGYALNAGTRDERDGEEGMAHFCEHITFKGTERRRAHHIMNCLDSVGGDLNAFTGKEDTVYHAAVLRNDIDRAVDILTDIVFHSVYPQKEIDKEVEVICDEIESYNDSPAELIADEFERMLFRGHALGHNILGDANRLRTYTSADARSFVARLYRPDNAVFFSYGDVDFDKMVHLLERAGHNATPEKPTVFDNLRHDTMPVYIPQRKEIEMNTHLSHVTVGNRSYGAGHPRKTTLYLLNNILGGPAMTARLNISLREHHALVYTVESYMSTYSDAGVWATYFGCEPHNVERCIALVRNELARLAAQPLSEVQLNKAKKQIKGQIGVACDNRESFALDFGRTYLHYGREKDIARLYADIDAIRADDILETAREIFRPDDISTLIIR